MTYDLASFILYNKEQLRDDIKNNVAKFIARETIFDGLFKLVFDKELEKFIVNELKDVLRKTYGNYVYNVQISYKNDTIEDINSQFVKKLTQQYFFDKSYYIR